MNITIRSVRVSFLLMYIGLLLACGGRDETSSSLPSQATGTLQFASASSSANQGSPSVTVQVTRSGGSTGTAAVNVATTSGTAIAGTDFDSVTNTLDWAAGDSSTKSFTVPLINTQPFSNSKTFSISLSASSGATLGEPSTIAMTIIGTGAQIACSGAASTVSVNLHITVDQFGYRPSDTKVAVIRDAQSGFDAEISNTFSPGSNYQIRSQADGCIVFSGPLVAWNNGATQASSGDKGWWFDFSSVTTPGQYFVYDVERNVRSATFSIDQQVYKNILKAATRMYFYQRSGIAKSAVNAGACWADAAAYLGPNQDSQARDITDQSNASKVKNLSGGWFDAGDTNKYVTFARQPVHQLLTAYQENPAAFTDDFNIPESGNGIPDVIDEVKWEVDWLKKMQYPDGSSAAKVGNTAYTSASPPSTDTAARFYVPSCTSATISIAGMFAHASYVYSKFPALTSEATDLKNRAMNAWNNYQSIPIKQLDCDTGIVHAGDSDLNAADQAAEAVVAATYLFAITGDATYNTYLKSHYKDSKPYHDFGWSRYDPQQGEALLFYTTLSTADTSLKQSILTDKLNDTLAGSQIYGFVPNDDLYRAFLHDAQYHWGSHNPRASYGNTNLDVITYKIAVPNTDSYRLRATEILHYFHGVNPFAKVYLSNMYSYGATSSVNQIFHSWFWENSKWSDAKTSQCGPAPGYIPGGPVANAASAGIPSFVSPPAGQPPQKSYKDWNTNSQTPWVVNEPGIYYQSSYLKLIAAHSN